MTTFENPFYYEQDLKTPIEQQFSPTTSMSTMSTTGTVDADFFLLGDVTSPMFNLSQDTSNWQYVASHLREQIFNSSSISFPAPETYFAKMAQDSGNSSNAAALLSMIDNNATFRFNSDPFCSEDAFAYRRHRSENLLIRMIHCRQMDISQLSLMRLSKGVFVHQKWVSSSPQSSPTLSTIENAFDYNLESTAEAPIDTFQFDNVLRMANHTSNPSSKCYDTFVPYSYTFGSRYTNPFDGTSDLMIRGKLPLWCQTLFLSECIKQGEPIRANEPRSGLFPFAPHITVTFRSLADSYSAHDFTAYPEMTVLYERFTMENIDPYALPEGCGALHEDQWPERKKEVLEGILLCDIPDSLATLLDDMANVWAASQGLIL